MLHRLKRHVNPGYLFLAAPQRAKHQQVWLGLRQDDPLAAAGPDQRPDSKGHFPLPKMFGYFFKVVTQSSLWLNRMTT